MLGVASGAPQIFGNYFQAQQHHDMDDYRNPYGYDSAGNRGFLYSTFLS